MMKTFIYISIELEDLPHRNYQFFTTQAYDNFMNDSNVITFSLNNQNLITLLFIYLNRDS